MIAEKARYQACSVGIHAGVIALALLGFTTPAVRKTIERQVALIDPPHIVPLVARAAGGGGQSEKLSVSKGQLPKAAKVFVRPLITDHVPLLTIAPSMVAPPDIALPQAEVNSWGDPLGKLANGSGGAGRGPYMGDGIGASHGSGRESGDSGVFGAGRGVSAPVLISRVDPEYSEEARKAKYSGTVVLSVVVDTAGRALDIRVSRSLGMGLDEKAVEAVRRWKFRAGLKDGQPVNVRARIEVNFRLL